jgi:N-acetylglucosamine-6-sulfatase
MRLDVRTAVFLATLLGGTIAVAAPPLRPNIVFVLIDDLRWDEVDYPFVRFPNIQRIAEEGVRFRNAFVTTPLCSPSRASFLTGQYAHRHGIVDNTDRSPRSHELVTFPRLLHDAGYETAFLGKWHMGLDDRARPGFDHWVSVPGQGRYVDPELNVNGTRKVVPGYFTDVIDDCAVEFLERKHTKPFLLFLAHKAVHPDLVQHADGSISALRSDMFLPADRHKDVYAGASIPHRDNYARPPVGKPALMRKIGDLPALGEKTVTDDETIRKRLRMLQAVDEGLARIFEVLEQRKILDDTLVVFTSDEGYFYGEHGLSEERRLAYEESIRIPLYIRWPRLIPKGRVLDPMVLGLDLAPTLLEIGGAPASPDMHGRSLVPLLRGEKVPWRESFLVEYFSDTVFPRVLRMGYQAVRTGRFTYIHYTDLEGMDELYDRDADPYELTNRIGDPAARATLEDLEAERVRLLRESP